MGEDEAAGVLYASALAQGRQTSRAAEVEALRSIAVHYDRAGRYPEAMAAYREAVAYQRERRDETTAGQILGNMALSLRRQGRLVEALQVYLEALSCAQQSGDRFVEGMWSIHLARLTFMMGDLAAARRWGEATLQIIAPSDNAMVQGIALRVLCEVALATSDLPLAQRYLEEMASLPPGAPGARPLLLAELRIQEGRGAEARPLLEEAIRSLKGQEDVELRAVGLLGILDAEAGDLAAARAALATLEARMPLPFGVSEVLARLAVLLREADA